MYIIIHSELLAAMTSFGFQAKNQTLFHAISDCQGSIDFPTFFDLLTARLGNKDNK